MVLLALFVAFATLLCFYLWYTRRVPLAAPPGAVVLVTGALGGIGKAVVLELLRSSDVHVIATDLAEDDSGTYAASSRVTYMQMNVCDEKSVAAVRQQLQQQNRRLWALLNVAGVAPREVKEGWKMEDEEVRRVLDVNFFGTLNCTRAFWSDLEQSNDNSMLLTVSSMAATMGMPFASPYCASKAATNSYMSSIRREVLINGQSVRVCLVEPTFVETDLTRAVEKASLAAGRGPLERASPFVSMKRVTDTIVHRCLFNANFSAHNYIISPSGWLPFVLPTAVIDPLVARIMK